MEAAEALHDTSLPLWGTAKRIVFRYFFIFIGLETWFGFNRHSINYNQAGLGWAPFFGRFFYWLDSRFYHIGYKPANILFVKTTDTPIGWVINITILWMAAVGCIVWSIADRRRRNYNKLDYWFRTYLAYYLYWAMVSYAVAKIAVTQMPFPNAASLLEPLGNKNRFDLLWSFIGVSPAYSVFTGICELTAALLVLSRRTRVLGCLFMFTITVNVVCFNIFYNVTVKLLSMQLLLINIYLLIPYVPKLIRIFYLHQPLSLHEKQYSFNAPWKNYLLVALLVAPAWATYGSATFYIKQRKNDLARQQRLYDVTVFVKGSDTLLPLLTDSFRIKRLVLTAYHEKYAVVYSMKDEPYGYYYTWDSTHKCITLMNGDDSTKKSLLHYAELPKNQLLLTGKWKGQNVTMLLTKFEIDSIPLVKEKIKWIQDN